MAMKVQTLLPPRLENELDYVREQYERQGYKVITHPQPEILPSELKDFHPDVIAERNNERVIGEINVPGRIRGSEYWSELQSAVKKLPNWRFDLIVLRHKATDEDTPPQPPELIRSVLLRAEMLLNESSHNAALLVSWSALEAAARHIAVRDNLQLNGFGASNLLAAVYGEGYFDPADYEIIREGIKLRNQISHGYQLEECDPNIVKNITRIAYSLLDIE